MSELLISILLLSAILVPTYFQIRKHQKYMKSVRSDQAQMESLRRLEEKFRFDLSRAIRTKGLTATSLPGISRYPDIAPTDPEISDGIRLLVESHGDLAVPTKASSNSAFVSKSELKPELYDYFTRIASKGVFLSLADSETRDAFEISGFGINSVTQDLELKLKSSESKIFGHGEARPLLQSLSEVTYQLNDKNQLIRQEKFRKDQEMKTEIVSTEVTNFRVRYVFTDRNESGTLILPGHAIATPKDPSYQAFCATGHCANWKDIQYLKFDLEFSKLATQEDARSSSFKIYPEQFQDTANGNQLSGDAFCRTDMDARCKPEYSKCFDSNDRSNQKWKEYGNLNGAFCKCGTDPDSGKYSPPENGAINLQPWPAQKSRWTACMQAYDGCSVGFLQGAPIQKMACTCLLRSATDYYRFNSATGYRTLNLPSSIQEISDKQDDDYNDLSCYDWQACDESAAAYFEVPPADPQPKLWGDLCGCLTHFKGQQNEDMEFQPVSQWNLDWRRLCHLPNSPSDCKNTSDDGGASYKIYSDSNKQGLSADNAIFCGCLKSKSIEPDQKPSMDWDFRTDNTLGIPTSPAYPDPKFGTLNSSSANVTTDSLGSIAGSCDLAYCHSHPMNMGCCTAAPDYPSAEPLLLDPYKNTGLNRYCKDSCYMGERYFELGDLRAILTGASDRWNLKVGCGGNIGGSSSGDTGGL